MRSQQQKDSDSGCLGCLAALLCCCCLGGAFRAPFLFPRLTVYVSEQRCAAEGWCRTRLRLPDFSYYFTTYLTQDVFFYLAYLLYMSCLINRSSGREQVAVPAWWAIASDGTADAWCQTSARAAGNRSFPGQAVPGQGWPSPTPSSSTVYK